MKYYIATYGCQMNKADSEKIAFILEKAKYQSAPRPEGADLIVVNMCSVRQSAVDRIYGISQRIKEIKKRKPKIKTILTGCILEKDRLKMRNKFDQILSIPEINEIFSENLSPSHYLNLKTKFSSEFSAYVPIMTGCNNFCSYCVVPYTRGREYSRPATEIIKEIEGLTKEKKYKEIILLGQNVNSYRDSQGKNFPKLLKTIAELPGNFWINFLTSHPKDLSPQLIEVMATYNNKICPYLHLALQSGDNDILRSMNRKYTVEKFEKIINQARKKIPQLNVSTDIIVGFPGESKKQFNNTKKAMQRIKFDMAYIAQFSPRPGTRADQMIDSVSLCQKKKRDKILNKILSQTALANNKKYIGEKMKTLVVNNQEAKSFNLKKIKLLNPAPVGNFVDCKITSAQTWRLIGQPLNSVKDNQINPN
jgi:tRNA-2-methylthio-N6-dimethylallyladenosine synthase